MSRLTPRRPHWRRLRPATISSVGVVVLMVLAAMPRLTGAAPGSPQPHSIVRATGGSYSVTASVFGTADDGQVGGQTSSGHTVEPDDHLVALPGCTDSSCPWVPDGTGTDGAYGPQTSCAEADGLCWVEIVSDDTGACAVAPVLDLGPLFVKDNWWAPTDQRTYDLPQGEPAAVAAAQGANLGYGPGISDIGLNIASDFSYAAGIDIAAGTWQDLGLSVGQGIAPVEVTMLWQTGVTHDQVCGGLSGSSSDSGGSSGGSGSTGGNAMVTTGLNLRAGPSTGDAVLTVMPAGARVTVTGGSQNGFYPVTYQGTNGWADGAYLDFDNGAPSGGGTSGGSTSGMTATVTTALNLRSGPSLGDAVILVMPAGATVSLTGDSQNGFAGVTYQGTTGWAYAAYLSTGGGGSASGSGAQTMTTTANLNLRDGPSLSAGIILVMPAGATVTVTGQSQNGYVSVSYQGTDGWAASAYLQ